MAPSKTTAGTAIASTICGAAGLLLCLPAPAGIVLGIIALVRIASEDQLKGKALAFTGIASGLLGLVLPTAGILYAIASLNRSPDQQAPYPYYDTLIGEGLMGSGFHFEHNGQRYIAASLHQFDGKTPSIMISLDFGEVPITRRVHTQHDVQILAYDSEQLDRSPPLVYDPNATIRRGDPVAILDDDTPITGRLVFSNAGPEDGLNAFKLDAPDTDLRGKSGSPVVSGITGTVIGVVIGTGPYGAVFEHLDRPEPAALSP